MNKKERIQKAFNKFNNEISIKETKRENLVRGRNGLRNRIKTKFAEKERVKPKFHMQGSFAMKTTVNPIKNKEYDVDDGVYLQGYENKDISEWPSVQTVHNWLKDAVEGYTSISPIDKNTCIRVVFADNYHVDLPIYICKNEDIYLAHKDKGWTVSDPKEFTYWFIDKVNKNGEQLRSIVKYLKAWKDYNNIDLKGLEVTILVANNFYRNADNDLSSILGTIANINNKLRYEFSCRKPVKPYEDLFENKTDIQREKILNTLRKLENELDKANNEQNIENVSDILRSIFGDRFPMIEKDKEEQENYVKTSSPAIIKNDGHSA